MARGPACDNWTQFLSVDPLRDARASMADQGCAISSMIAQSLTAILLTLSFSGVANMAWRGARASQVETASHRDQQANPDAGSTRCLPPAALHETR
jgi:hypothetical protein